MRSQEEYSSVELGYLATALISEIQQEGYIETKGQLYDRLLDEGYDSETANKMAVAMTAQLTGNPITSVQHRILKDAAVEKIYSEINEYLKNPSVAEDGSWVKTFDDNLKPFVDKINNLKDIFTGIKETADFQLQSTAEGEEVTENVATVQGKSDVDVSQESPQANTVAASAEAEDGRNGNVFRDAPVKEIARPLSAQDEINTLFGKTKSYRQRQIESTAEKFGIKMVWSEAVSRGKYNPQTNTITMNPNTTLSNAYITIFKHEFSHYLENRKGYAEFKKYLFESSKAFLDYVKTRLEEETGKPFTGTRAEMMKAYAEVIYERYRNDGEIPAATRNKFTMEDAEREVVADFVGDVLLQGDNIELADKALNELAETHRNLLQRLIDWVKELISKLRHEPQNRTLTQDLEYLNERLARVYDSTIKNTAENSGEKWSVLEFSDGNQFVEIEADQERFVGLTPEEMRKEARKVIKERFVGTVIGNKNRAFVKSKSAEEYSYPSKFIKDPQIIEAKMRASTELDNLVDAGQNFRNEPDGKDGHFHPEATGGFDYYDTVFKIGNNYYYGLVNIMVTDKGKVLKDITKIEDITNDIIAQYGANPQGNFVEISSNNNIPHPEEKVKESFSIRKATPLSDPKKYANKILRRNRSRQDAGVLAEQLKKISEAAQQSDYAAAWNLAKEAAQGVIDSSKNLEMLADDAIELLEDIRNSAIKLNSTQRSETAYAYGTYNDYRKRNMGRIKLRQDGLPLDIKWQEWAAEYPHIFDAETSDADMPMALVNIIDSLKSTYVDYDINAATESLASQIFTEVIRRLHLR